MTTNPYTSPSVKTQSTAASLPTTQTSGLPPTVKQRVRQLLRLYMIFSGCVMTASVVAATIVCYQRGNGLLEAFWDDNPFGPRSALRQQTSFGLIGALGFVVSLLILKTTTPPAEQSTR